MSLSDLFRAFKRSGPGQTAEHSNGESAFPAARTGIHPWLQAGDRLVASLQVDGQPVCHIDEVAAHDGMRRQPSAEFRMPTGARKALLTGTLTRKEDNKAIAFKRAWGLADAAPYTSALNDDGITLDRRLLKFSAQLEALDQANGDYRFREFRAEPGTPVDEELSEAGRRLGLGLPPALAQVLGLKTEVGNSYFHRPKDLATVEKTLLSGLWGHESLETQLAPEVLARYRRSVAVFTEVGDGLGALAYDPQGVQPGEASNAWGDNHGPGARAAPSQGAWFWLHQGSLNQPTLLLDRRCLPASGEQAVLSVLRRLVVGTVLDAANEYGNHAVVDDEKTIWVDSSHPHALLQLHFDGNKPRLWLRSYDHFYALL
jgi:hypothetical protein